MPESAAGHHIIFCVECEPDRRAALQVEVERQRPHADLVITLPEGIADLHRYVEEVQRAFPVFSPLGMPREEMSWDQVWDMHLDWAELPGANTLVVWPEIDGTDWRSRLELGEILGDYIHALEAIDSWEQPERPRFKMLASCAHDLTGLHEAVRLHWGRAADAPPEIEVARRRIVLKRAEE